MLGCFNIKYSAEPDVEGGESVRSSRVLSFICTAADNLRIILKLYFLSVISGSEEETELIMLQCCELSLQWHPGRTPNTTPGH